MSGGRQRQLPDVPFTIGSDIVMPVRCVCNVSLRMHVSKTVASLFCSSTSDQKHTMLSEQTSTAVTSHIADPVTVNYGTATLADVPGICLINCCPFSMLLHVWCTNYASMTMSLHCLGTSTGCRQVSECITYQLAILVFCCHSHTAPEYMARNLHWDADNDSQRHL